MDKTKKKTDLLAAGRKKFRKKKDNKGNKSSPRFAKTERNDDTSSPRARKGKQSMRDADDVVASPESHSQGKALEDGDNDVATVSDQPPGSASAETTAEEATELSVEDSIIGDAKLSTDVSDEYPVQDSSIQEGDSFVAEEVAKSSDAEILGVAESKEQFTDSPVDSQFPLHGQYQDPLVTALGAMQNAEGLGLMQLDEIEETVNGEDGKLPSSESDAPLVVSTETMDDQSEAIVIKPSIDYPKGTSLSAEYGRGDMEEIQVETAGKGVDTQGSSVSNSDIYEEVNRSEINEFPPRQDVAEMGTLLERLKEQLYLTTLVKDTAHLELSEQIDVHSELSQQSQQFSNKLSSASTSLDEIYVKNENLAEEVAQYKYQLNDAVSMKEGLQEELDGSKAEVEKSSSRINQLLNELEISQGDLSRLSTELVECRDSLVAFQTENETLRQSLHLATEENEQLVVQKTSMKLENEQLASQLISLQTENTNINEHVAAGGHNNKITSENELLLSQNDKLVTELGECKNMLLNLQRENENLNATVLEEKKKIDHEKDYLLNESEEIVIESIKCMVLVEAVQMEIFSNKRILVPVSSETSRLEEEKIHFLSENEKLSRELVNYKAMIESYESLKEHSDCEKEANLEHMILLEALRQHVRETNVKGSELVALYEASQEKAVNLRAENSTITSKISDCEAKLSDLQSQLDETYQRSCEMFSYLSSQVEGLNEVVLSREIVLEEEWNSVGMQIIQTLDKLNSSSTMISFNSSSNSSDIRSCVAASVDVATNTIEDLKSQLEAAKSNHELVLSTYNEVNKEFDGLQERTNLSREMFASKPVEFSYLHGHIDHLILSLIQHENEIIVLKESLKSYKDSVVAVQSELQGQIAEHEKSEQRISSLREKLGIAVSKGKGLVVQRDSLKQSLAETSADFENCKQDLLTKESRFSELENKLKDYMEAGERMETLESELSYIRNSATSLRESFLLKDSALQRIEEILEDLELPEHFHSGDIIEKVDWLAKYVSGNSLPLTDFDQKTSVAGGAYSDAGMVDAEGWKEEMQPNTDTSDYYRKIYEELQSRFYGLAEQNEMLEQSLMERDNLVQRWEEIMDRIGVPLQLQSMEPEDRIEWMGSTLSEAQNRCNSLQEKIDNLETSSASVTTDLERSEQRTSELQKALQSLITENETLSQNLEILTEDYDEMSKKASGLETDKGSLEREVVSLQERLDQKNVSEERAQYFEGEIRRLQDVVMGVLQDSGLEDSAHKCDGFDYFEGLLMKLLEKHSDLSRAAINKPDAEQVTEDPRDPVEQFKVPDNLKAEIIILNKQLDDINGELLSLKEERHGYLENNHSLAHEVEALETKMINLQDHLSQEEHKSHTLREKLNVAVRKGKSLMQQRDSMKQVVEETNSEIGRLKSVISEYENKTKDLSTLQERLETVRSENISLRDVISQNGQTVQVNDHTLSLILEALGHIDVGLESDTVDPVEKLEKLGKRCKDLLSDLATMEQESSKSKRAAELLVVELNEVEERNDVLQEELAKASTDLSALSRERDYYQAEATQARSILDQLDNALSSLSELLGHVLSNELETLHDLKVCIKSCRELGDAPSLPVQPSGSIPGDLISFKSGDEVLIKGIGSIRGQLHRHLELVHEERSGLADVIGLTYSELNSQKESCESMRRDIQRLESVEIEKDSKLLFARRNFSLLLDACMTTVTEIDKFKTELVGRGFASNDSKVKISPKTSEFTEETLIFCSEEGIKAIQEQLFSAVKDLMSMQAETSDVNLKDLRSTIHNLQKELHEKEIQGERNCMQLVQQIKEAEAIANKYSQELQLSQGHVEDLQREVRVMEEEHNVVEKRAKDLQDKEAACMEYKGKIQSLTDELAVKGQENESLLQALDEEEIQMEDMRNKIGELERVLKHKDKDLEKLDISRKKSLKKLSVTVSKFDELHLLSENLLSEVENLQSQLQDRDQEISFLRQEVTRCTKDALLASQASNKMSSNEVSDLLEWLATMFSGVQASESSIGDMMTDEGKEMLKEQISSAVSELEDLRVAVRNREMLLQLEKSKVEELTSKEQSLQSYLCEKESQLAMLRGDVGQATSTSPKIVELEPMINKRAAPAAAPQVRSLRKANNEQVAIAIDVDQNNEKLEEEDDDKAHGFKSLTTSRIVPRFTRPVTNLVDGLWVSCDRTLMRQPVLRLVVMIYWAFLHALLAAYVV